MSILSFEFLAFLALMAGVTYLLPVRVRWMGFLAGSLVFYAQAGLEGLAYLLAVTLVTWGAGLYMGRSLAREKAARAEDDRANAHRMKRRRKWLLTAAVLLVIGGMCVIKYADVLHIAANALYVALTKSREPLNAMTLFVPLGLSYFTFQSVGYVIDCVRGKTQPEKNPLKYLLFLSFFPQITQGPITTCRQLMPQLTSPRRFDPAAFVEGFQLALWGYFKKLVLADRLAPVTDAIARSTEQPGLVIVLGLALYALRLYADFSGGMDVIRGAARMLGVEMAENFRRPFFASSVGEYWRRWHISLGGWFRTYLFYPLSTSRFGLALGRLGQKVLGKKVGRNLPGALATFIIFFLIGLWHTANWNAVLYGVYFGVMLSAALLLEPLFKRLRTLLRISPNARWWKGVGMVRTWGLIGLAQVFAFTAGPEAAATLLAGAFRNWRISDTVEALTALLPPLEWAIAVVALLIVLLVDLLCERGINVNGRLARCFFPLRWVVLIALILSVLIFGCYGAGYDAAAFLYTNF